MFEYIRLLVTARREECAGKNLRIPREGGETPGNFGATGFALAFASRRMHGSYYVEMDRKQGKISAIFALNIIKDV